MKHYEMPEMKVIESERLDIVTISGDEEDGSNQVEQEPGGGNNPWQ